MNACPRDRPTDPTDLEIHHSSSTLHYTHHRPQQQPAAAAAAAAAAAPALPSTCHTVALPPEEAAKLVATYPPYSLAELAAAKRWQLIPGEVLYCEVSTLGVCVGSVWSASTTRS